MVRLKRLEKVFLFFDLSFVDRCNRLAFASNLGGDTHHHFAHRARIDQQIGFRLAQHVDESGRNDETLRIDRASGGCLREIANRDDAIVFDPNVGNVSLRVPSRRQCVRF